MATMTQERTERETTRQAQPGDAPQTQGETPTPMSITIVENGPYVVNGSVPLLEEAFELTLMPHWSVFAAVYLSVSLATILLSVIVSYFIAGATTPRTF